MQLRGVCSPLTLVLTAPHSLSCTLRRSQRNLQNTNLKKMKTFWKKTASPGATSSSRNKDQTLSPATTAKAEERWEAALTRDHVGTKEDPGGGDERPEHHHEADEQPETSSCGDTRFSPTQRSVRPPQQEAEPVWDDVLAAGEEDTHLSCPGSLRRTCLLSPAR